MRINLKLFSTFLLSLFFLLGCQKDSEIAPPPAPPDVNAGPKQSVQLPQTSFNLTGSATSTNGAIRAWQWSLVSGPNLPVISSPASQNTIVSGFIKGNYIFQLTATDASGYTGVDTTLVQVQNDYIVFTLFPPVVEAGTGQTIQLPASGFTLNGNATSTNGSIRAWLWSLVSGPNMPLITSPGSKTTNVSGIVPGRYLFQLMAIDSAGLTGVDTTGITVLPSPQQTLTLQPANNPNERHLWGNSILDQSGHATELVAGTWTSGSNVFIRGALKFDLSSIPASATILEAKLTLYSNPTPLNGNQTVPNEGPNNAMYIRRISNDWNPATTFWLSQPSTTTIGQVAIPHTSLPSLDLVDTDVKALVTAMHSGGNYGFMILLQNETPFNMRNFCSSIHAITSKHPKLIVTYQP